MEKTCQTKETQVFLANCAEESISKVYGLGKNYSKLNNNDKTARTKNVAQRNATYVDESSAKVFVALVLTPHKIFSHFIVRIRWMSFGFGLRCVLSLSWFFMYAQSAHSIVVSSYSGVYIKAHRRNNVLMTFFLLHVSE